MVTLPIAQFKAIAHVEGGPASFDHHDNFELKIGGDIDRDFSLDASK